MILTNIKNNIKKFAAAIRSKKLTSLNIAGSGGSWEDVPEPDLLAEEIKAAFDNVTFTPVRGNGVIIRISVFNSEGTNVRDLEPKYYNTLRKLDASFELPGTLND